MKQIRAAHCNTLHSTFCSPFSSLELSTAISQLSTSSGPDQITYPLLSHLPQSALHFLLYIFNLSWSTHTFPSAWKQSTIIPILKPGKPSNLPSSYIHIVDSVVEWLKHRTDDQHGLGSKPTCTILLCPWERHFTALSPAWWS